MVLKKVTNFFYTFLNFFYPDLCLGCGENLLSHEKFVCTKCLFKIPRTGFHDDPENIVNKLFWGKVNVEHATAFYYFHKGGVLQEIIHHLKYKGCKEVGWMLGKHFGADMLNTKIGNEIDVVLPIPLHPKREFKRGYNQAEWIAMGISEILDKPIDTKSIFRNTETQTQTKKNRMQRWDNVESIFSVSEKHQLQQKHVLIIDDVITTGSTIESCVNTILSIPGTRVSVAALAVASK